MKYSYEDYLKKGQQFKYRIKPTRGIKFPWRIDIWIYQGEYSPLWCCTTKYFTSRKKAVEWRIKRTESD